MNDLNINLKMEKLIVLVVAFFTCNLAWGQNKLDSLSFETIYRHQAHMKPRGITWWGGYNYSKYFPVGMSVNYTRSYLSIGVELGGNIDKDKYYFNDVYYKDPFGYALITPGLYFAGGLSINCGVGLLMSDKMNILSSISGNEISKSYDFMLKPSVKYLLFSFGNYGVTIGIGYNICPNFKDLNGFDFCLGFRWFNQLM